MLETEQGVAEDQPHIAGRSRRILHMGKYFPPYSGGMETYLRDLMVAQAKQGLESTALVHKSALSLCNSTEQYAAGEQTLSVTRAAVWATTALHAHQPDLSGCSCTTAESNDDQPTILHLHMPNVSVFLGAAGCRARGGFRG